MLCLLANLHQMYSWLRTIVGSHVVLTGKLTKCTHGYGQQLVHMLCLLANLHQMYSWLRTIVGSHDVLTGKLTKCTHGYGNYWFSCCAYWQTFTKCIHGYGNYWFSCCAYWQTFTKCIHGYGQQLVLMMCLLANIHQMYSWLRTIVGSHVVLTGKHSPDVLMVTDNSWFTCCAYWQTFTKCIHGYGQQFVLMLCLLANLHQMYSWLRTIVGSHVVLTGKPSPNVFMVTDTSWFSCCAYWQTFTKCIHGYGQ